MNCVYLIIPRAVYLSGTSMLNTEFRSVHLGTSSSARLCPLCAINLKKRMIYCVNLSIFLSIYVINPYISLISSIAYNQGGGSGMIYSGSGSEFIYFLLRIRLGFLNS